MNPSSAVTIFATKEINNAFGKSISSKNFKKTASARKTAVSVKGKL